MDLAVFRSFEEIIPKELATGFWAQTIHTPCNTINFIVVKSGSTFPLHNHIHHQTAFVLDGKFEMTVNDETRVLLAGEFVLIPTNAPHKGIALTDCRLLDIFSPVREDYK